eukprot:5675180-Pyramimonas_sp.AAC.1
MVPVARERERCPRHPYDTLLHIVDHEGVVHDPNTGLQRRPSTRPPTRRVNRKIVSTYEPKIMLTHA